MTIADDLLPLNSDSRHDNIYNSFRQSELKGEQGDTGVKGEKGEPGGGFYDPRFGGVQGPPGKPGLPVSST